jgi:hypothetical protein
MFHVEQFQCECARRSTWNTELTIQVWKARRKSLQAPVNAENAIH